MRSNSDQAGRDAPAALGVGAPQLGGLFAAGMPKLRKTGAGVDTGGMLRVAQLVSNMWFLIRVQQTKAHHTYPTQSHPGPQHQNHQQLLLPNHLQVQHLVFQDDQQYQA